MPSMTKYSNTYIRKLTNTNVKQLTVKAKIKKSNVQDILELNMIQEGMLYHYLRENEENIYNVQLSFRIEGEVDPVLLKKAFESVQAGNEVLRSVFSWEKLSRPVQIIFKDC